jgi:hypothetical protein
LQEVLEEGELIIQVVRMLEEQEIHLWLVQLKEQLEEMAMVQMEQVQAEAVRL